MFTEGGCFPPPLSDHMDTRTHNRKQIKLTDLKPDTSNANRGTERGLRVLDDSLAKVGLGRSIVVDKNLNVVAGNKTLERAVDQGFEDAEIIPTQGDKLIVVLREDFDLYADDPNNSARQYAYYDNRSSELDLQWDVEQLLADIQAGFDFDGLFREDELDAITNALIEPDWGDVFGSIPVGDKTPFQQMTFILHDSQVETIQAALKRAKSDVPDETPNKNSNGNALWIVCEAYLNG